MDYIGVGTEAFDVSRDAGDRDGDVKQALARTNGDVGEREIAL